jgi:hypothetical protein
MNKIKELWTQLQLHAHIHHKAYHRTHHGMHLCYLGLVATHGPYNFAAAGLFVLVLVGWVLHLEE